MFYLQLWTNYLQTMADLVSQKPEQPPRLPLKASASPAENKFSAKEKYEYLTEYGTQVLCLFSAQQGCSYLSRNFEAITGNDAEFSLGQSFFQFVHPDFRERLQELIVEQRGKTEPLAYRCKLRHGDGKHYWYLFLIHGKTLDDSAETVCIVENVHDSIQIQNSLQKAKLEAELALRSRSEFLANMSHDLRTPLNAVIGFAQIMENEIFGKIESPQYLEYVKHIQESGYDLLAKIEDLLEIASIDAGRVTLEREDVYLSHIVQKAIDAQQHHASSANITLEYESTQGDVLLNVDRVKLQHILGHLLANAIKHSHKDGKVSLKVSQGEERGLRICISDCGQGMPKAKLDGIMTALEQENCWTAKNSQGIGLGLALTKEFIALHGGSVAIESRANEGTTVCIDLPASCIGSAPVKEPLYLRQA